MKDVCGMIMLWGIFVFVWLNIFVKYDWYACFMGTLFRVIGIIDIRTMVLVPCAAHAFRGKVKPWDKSRRVSPSGCLEIFPTCKLRSSYNMLSSCYNHFQSQCKLLSCLPSFLIHPVILSFAPEVSDSDILVDLPLLVWAVSFWVQPASSDVCLHDSTCRCRSKNWQMKWHEMALCFLSLAFA